MQTKLEATPAELGAASPEVVEIEWGSQSSPLVLLCDHADNFIPLKYHDLGLSRVQLARHIAYDIGAALLTRALAKRLNATAVLTTHSRLLVDPNRGLDELELIPAQSDGTKIPGNAIVDDGERAHRIALYYEPYHRGVEAVINSRLQTGMEPIVVSIHSFTPIWKGDRRPWHVGVLWDGDDSLARQMIDRLSEDPNLIVGENVPYSGLAPNYGTLHRHAVDRGLPHVLIEIRQDLLSDADGGKEWADRLVPVLSEFQSAARQTG